MAFSPLVQRYFDAWINRDTWHTSHANDRELFYMFVRNCLRYSKKDLSGSDIKEEILAVKAGQMDAHQLEECANEFQDLFDELKGFQAAPDHDDIIEKRNIVRYYTQLLTFR